MTVKLPKGLNKKRLIEAITEVYAYKGRNREEFACSKIAEVMSDFFERILIQGNKDKIEAEFSKAKEDITKKHVDADLSTCRVNFKG